MIDQTPAPRLLRLLRCMRSRTVAWHIGRYLISIAVLLLIWWGVSALVEYVKEHPWLDKGVAYMIELTRKTPLELRLSWARAQLPEQGFRLRVRCSSTEKSGMPKAGKRLKKANR